MIGGLNYGVLLGVETSAQFMLVLGGGGHTGLKVKANSGQTKSAESFRQLLMVQPGGTNKLKGLCGPAPF